MPVYEYRCRSCNARRELNLSLRQVESQGIPRRIECECGDWLWRRWGTFHWRRGVRWYANGIASGSLSRAKPGTDYTGIAT